MCDPAPKKGLPAEIVCEARSSYPTQNQGMRGYREKLAGRQHLAAAMAEKIQRLPADIAQTWMGLIEHMGLEDWLEQ